MVEGWVVAIVVAVLALIILAVVVAIRRGWFHGRFKSPILSLDVTTRSDSTVLPGGARVVDSSSSKGGVAAVGNSAEVIRTDVEGNIIAVARPELGANGDSTLPK